ncbi:hypothetical protein E4K64_07710 [Bradyrhizobium frederickii]|uniref:Uncharacterized protein n=1 Tax=Bradyrhizobium frederickii TaxID=2560054 RepID=A0A4Y9PJ86_9BRAD|nr:hypothetical protein E4K64_07710 [Bradyrhizobium frederickii]
MTESLHAGYRCPHAVMAGLVPAIHALQARRTWMPGTSPGMTTFCKVELRQSHRKTDCVDVGLH